MCIRTRIIAFDNQDISEIDQARRQGFKREGLLDVVKSMATKRPNFLTIVMNAAN